MASSRNAMKRRAKGIRSYKSIANSIMQKAAVTRIQAVLLIAVIIVASVAAVTYYYYSNAPATNEVVIAAILPLSGSMSTIGANSKNGHDLAVQDINSAGGIKSLGGAKIKIIYSDVQSDPTVAVTETERLIATYHPVAIVGGYASSLSLPIAQVAESHKVPFLATVAQADALTNVGYKYVFRQMARASLVGAIPIDVTLDMANHTGTTVQNVALLFDNSIAIQVQQATARQHAKDLGLNIVFDESYTTGVSDFTPLVTKLKAANPDVLVTFSFTNDAILLARTIRQMDVNLKGYISTGGGYLEPDFITSAGNASEYILAGAGWMGDLNIPGLSEVVNRYFEKYGVFMNEHAGLSYTATWLLKEVLELSGKLHADKPFDPDSIRDAFLTIDITSGPAVMNAGGRAKFQVNGDNLYATYVYLQILNGTQRSVWPFERASTQAVWPMP